MNEIQINIFRKFYNDLHAQVHNQNEILQQNIVSF